MSKLFGNLDTAGVEEQGDRLGGRVLVASGLYKGAIKVAYAGKSQSSQAQSITVVFKTETGQELRETFWITDGQGNPFYTKDGKKNQLPGYAAIEELCQVTTGKSITEQDSEEKMVNIYDYEQKKEVPTSVNVMSDLTDAEVTIGVFKQLVNKQKKNETSGKYEDTADTQETNSMEKFFHSGTGMTYQEIKRDLEKGEFIDLWDEKYSGKDQDRRKNKGDGSGKAGAPPAKSAGETGERRTLFGKK